MYFIYFGCGFVMGFVAYNFVFFYWQKRNKKLRDDYLMEQISGRDYSKGIEL
jgi:hypothetical protein